MSATRWNTLNLMRWLEEHGWPDEDLELKEMILDSDLPGQSTLGSTQSLDPEQISDGNQPQLKIPDTLPILPLRGLVVYPETAVPLTIGQPRSIRLVDDVVAGEDRLIGLVTSRDPELEIPEPKDLYEIGTVAMIHRLFRAPDGTIRLLVQGTARFKLGEFTQHEPYLKAEIHLIPETEEEGVEVEALARNARDQFAHIGELITSIPRELVASVQAIEDPLQTVYTIANFQRMDLSAAQKLLELDSATEKLRKLVSFLSREIEVLEIGQKIQNEARSEIEKMQRDYFLREQLKAIQRELGEGDEQAAEVEELRQKIDAAKMPEEADKQARRELDRLSHLPTAAAEYGVIRTYLDWMVSLPWSVATEDNLDISHAREVLDQDHYGLQDVKERILEYLAVRKLRMERKDEFTPETKDEIRGVREGVILCFIGPPGVGKTSLGRSIAHAMGRKFIRISLGGMRDEAEIRGHRRTYIGALPGRVIQEIFRAGSNNPVFMLDEVDKIGVDFRGDPASALLEVLDPEQNFSFTDHYLDVPFDLTNVMFITTANILDPIPPALKDRMEVITLSGYTTEEKQSIAVKFLIPREVEENGLSLNPPEFTEPAIAKVIGDYTREAGVRNLQRNIASICRKVAKEITQAKPLRTTITPETVEEFLGPRKFFNEAAAEKDRAGVVTGLAWTETGGDIIFVEATRMKGKGELILTGSLGDVMKESARTALSFVQANSAALGIPVDSFEEVNIHIHVPAGSIPKDGPSAGITMVTSIVSLMTGRLARRDTAMTGEISLTGRVLAIGGLKEKVLAARRAGVKKVILPDRNRQDLEDVPEDVRQELEF